MTKKRAKAKPKVEQTPQTELEELFAKEGPQDEPTEEPEEPKPGEEPTEEPAATEEYTQEPEPEEEPTEEPSEEEREKLAAEAREKEQQEREKREKGLRDEISKLRENVQRLKAEKSALQTTPQAPIPGQMPTTGQPQFPPYGQPVPEQQQTAPTFQVPVSFDGDTPSVDLTPLFSAYETRFRQQLEQAMRPDPFKAEQAAIADARTKWIGVDPEQALPRSQAAQRMEQASNLLAEKFDEYTMRTGVAPKGFQQVVDLIDHSEIGDTLRTYFPDVQDTASFVDAFFMPVMDPSVRIWKLRSYMDRYMASQTQQQQASEPEPQSTGEPMPSNVVRIPDKPRSMATKGQGAAAAMTDKARFAALGDEIGKEVFVPDDTFKEYQRLGKKLGIEGF